VSLSKVVKNVFKPMKSIVNQPVNSNSEPRFARYFSMPILLMAIVISAFGCNPNESSSANQESPKSLQKTPASASKEGTVFLTSNSSNITSKGAQSAGVAAYEPEGQNKIVASNVADNVPSDKNASVAQGSLEVFREPSSIASIETVVFWRNDSNGWTWRKATSNQKSELCEALANRSRSFSPSFYSDAFDAFYSEFQTRNTLIEDVVPIIERAGANLPRNMRKY